MIVHRLLLESLKDYRAPPYDILDLDTVANHLNDRTGSQNGRFESRKLFLALYFAAHPTRVNGVVSSIKNNGFIAYISSYGISVPVYVLGSAETGAASSDMKYTAARTANGEALISLNKTIRRIHLRSTYSRP